MSTEAELGQYIFVLTEQSNTQLKKFRRSNGGWTP